MITKEFVQSVRGRLESNPAISTADIARELGAREVDVITSMPVPMRKKARPQDFSSIWHELEAVAPVPSLTISEDDLGYIWFVAHPSGNAAARSVRFFDKQGGHLVSVPLSGGEGDGLYESMTERFGVTPVPKRSACKGCGKCRCGKQKSHGHHCQ